MKRISEKPGFTLIECLIAMFVLTVGILSLFTMQISAIQGNSTANQITKAAAAGASQLEHIFAMNYSDVQLNDVDGDNINGLQDAQCCPNGKDPFGKTVEGCTAKADGCAQGEDNSAIYWNVTPNSPMPATKRVRVILPRKDRGVLKTTEFEYIKAKVVQR